MCTYLEAFKFESRTRIKVVGECDLGGEIAFVLQLCGLSIHVPNFCRRLKEPSIGHDLVIGRRLIGENVVVEELLHVVVLKSFVTDAT